MRVASSPAPRARLALLAGLAALAGCGRDIRESIPFLPSSKYVEVGGRRLTHEEVRIYQSIKDLSAATKVNPRDAVAYNNLGQLFQTRGNYDLAKELYVQATKLDPTASEAHHNLGVIAIQEGHYEDAVIHLGRALRVSPDDARIYHRLGQAYAGQGDARQAVANYDLALQKDNEFTPAYLDKARVLYGERQYREAEAACRQALAHLPKVVAPTAAKESANPLLSLILPSPSDALPPTNAGAEAAYDLALCLKAQGRLSEALTELVLAGSAPAARGDVQILKSQLLEGLNRREEAVAVLEALRKEFPASAEVPKRLARLYQSSGRPEPAARARLDAAELDHSDRPLQLEAVRAAEATHDPARLIAIYERLVRLDAKDRESRRALAAAYEQAGLKRQAAFTWQEVSALEGGEDAATRRRLGLLYADLPGFQGRAVLQFKAVLEGNPRDAEVRRKLGELYLGSRNFSEAERHLRWALELEPRDAAGHLKLADLYVAQKRGEEAVVEYRKALELQPDLPEARLRLGQALRELDRKDEAAVALAEHLKTHPLDEAARRQYAETLRDLNRREEAVQEYQALAALHPYDVATAIELAKLARLLGKFSEAAGMYEALLEKNPSNVEALRATARLYDELKQPLRGMYCWQRLLRLQAGDLEAQARLASLYRTLGADDAAIAKYEALGRSGDADAWLSAAFLHLRRGEQDLAAADYRKVIEAGKLDSPKREPAKDDKPRPEVAARMALASLLQKGGQPAARDEALELYQQVVALDPDNERARLNLGNLLTENNRLADAQEQYLAILKKKKEREDQQQPQNVPAVVGACVGLGVLHRKGGRYQEALACYKEALNANPDNRELHFNLGVLYDFYINDAAEAKKHYDRFVELNGDPSLLPEPADGSARVPAAGAPELRARPPAARPADTFDLDSARQP